MFGFKTNQQAAAAWLASLHSALRTTLACTIVAIATLYGPHSLRRHISLPAFSYVTIILIITDATLGDTLRACWLALYASAQSLAPAMLTLWLIRPDRLTSGVTALAVALGGLLVLLPGPKVTHLVSKRIALGQIVLVYVIAFINGPSTDPIMHPLHVAASTSLGVFACVLALLLPYPSLASYQVKNKSELYAENALKRLRLYVKAFCGEERGAATSCITRAKTLSAAGQKLLQVIKHMQESMRWERPPFRFLRQYYVTPAAKLQELETVLRGMEISSTAANNNNTNSANASSAQTMLINSELREGLEEHLNLTEKQVKCWLAPNDSTTVPESNTEVAMKFLQTFQAVNPVTVNELPSLFFLFCFMLLHRESVLDSDRADSSDVIKPESLAKAEKTELSVSQIWRNYGPGSGLTNQNLMAAFRCFLSLGLAVFLGLVYSKPDGFWAGLPVAISLASAREATFKVANLKAQGTVLGTVYAVLICYAFANSLPLRFMSLLPWFVFCSFLRKSKMYGQAGGLSAIIGAVLILGRKGFGGPKEFAIARIVETFIGLSCSVAVDIMFQPTRASTLAKAELARCLYALKHCVARLNLGEFKTDCNGQMLRLRTCMNELSKYIAEAEAEPNFWFLAFNSASYNKLKLSFTSAADYLLFGSQAIQFLQQEATKLTIESWKDVAENLSNDIKQFAEAASCLIQCFESVTVSKLKSMTELDNTNPAADDVETGKSPNLKKLLLAGAKENDELGVTVRQYVEHVSAGLLKLEGAEDAKGQVMLCLGAIGFCMDGLAREVREMERGVKEIILCENLTSSHIDLHQISRSMNTEHH